MMPTHVPVSLGRQFTHIVDCADHLLLISDSASRTFMQPHLRAVLELADGSRDALTLVRDLGDRCDPMHAWAALALLEREGILERAVPEVEQAPTRTDTDLGPAAAHDLARNIMGAWTGRSGGAALHSAKGGRCRLLLTEDYLHDELRSLPRNHAPILMVRLGACETWVGPWVGAGMDVCLSCLRHRLLMNLPGRAFVSRCAHSEHGSASVRELRRAVSFERFRFIAEQAFIRGFGKANPLDPRGVFVHGISGEAPTRHESPSRPGCPDCGDPAVTAPGHRVTLHPRRIEDRTGGGLRVTTISATRARLRTLVDPLVGVIRDVRKVDIPDAQGLHVRTASHAGPAAIGSVEAVLDGLRDLSGGKGATPEQAEVSALAESVERVSALHRPNVSCVRERASHLPGAVVLPGQWQQFSQRQYDTRAAWNRSLSNAFHWVPERYENQIIDWSPFRSLVSGSTKYAPSTLLYLGFTGAGARFGRGDSNGLAAGNCVEEAVLQGLLELVERDAVALWWYNRANRPGVALEDWNDPFIRDTLEAYQAMGRAVWVLDLTSDLRIPCYTAVSVRTDGEPDEIILGFGAHLDARIALRRAVTELSQLLSTACRPAEQRRRQLLPRYVDAVHWWETASLSDHPYLRPAEGPPRSIPGSALDEPGDLTDYLSACLDRIADVGLDVLVHDLTQPDIDFPVVRVVVPGLRHFWRRLGPGRLYETPQHLGWLRTANTESTMNPVSIFL